MIPLSSISDQDLVLLLSEDNQQAYLEIYNRYNWLLHKHACTKLGDRDAASDVIQEIFTSLWVKRNELTITSTLSAYLYTATRNRILNLIEHRTVQSKYIHSLTDYAQTFVAGTDHLVRERQLMAIIEKEIGALPPRMREVFELSRKSQLTHKEIAEQLGISEETVKSQIKKALKVLRIRLGPAIYLLFIVDCYAFFIISGKN